MHTLPSHSSSSFTDIHITVPIIIFTFLTHDGLVCFRHEAASCCLKLKRFVVKRGSSAAFFSLTSLDADWFKNIKRSLWLYEQQLNRLTAAAPSVRTDQSRVSVFNLRDHTHHRLIMPVQNDHTGENMLWTMWLLCPLRLLPAPPLPPRERRATQMVKLTFCLPAN